MKNDAAKEHCCPAIVARGRSSFYVRVTAVLLLLSFAHAHAAEPVALQVDCAFDIHDRRATTVLPAIAKSAAPCVIHMLSRVYRRSREEMWST